MKIKIDKEAFNCGGCFKFGIKTSVDELERVLGGEMFHYKHPEYFNII